MDEIDIATELAEIKDQLNQLEVSRREQAVSDSAKKPVKTRAQKTNKKTKVSGEKNTNSEYIESDDDDWISDLENMDPEKILERIKLGAGEWLDELNLDLKETKPSTVLMVFSLGVMVGRLSN